MAVLPVSHLKHKQSTTNLSKTVLRAKGKEQRSTREMAGRNLLDAAPAAGAKMNKGKIVKIAAVYVMAMLLLTVAVVSMARYDAGRLLAFVGSDAFLMFCVASHATTICLLAWLGATAPTPASRRSYGKAIVASFVQLAINLYMVLAVRRAEVQDTTA